MAGWLLAALWIFSMSGVDAHALSAFPVCVVLVAVLLLAGLAVVCGKRVVRMSGTGWFALLAGGYFLVRCLNSYAVVDSWGEAALILGAMVYYVAGVYVAQNKNYGCVLAVLSAALALNLLAMWAVRQPWFCLEWTGRAAYTPEGGNTLPVSLFVYKNFAGVFLGLGGSSLLVCSLWMLRGALRWGGILLGCVAVAASFFCGTRAVLLVLPLAIIVLWGARLLFCLFHNRRLGVVNVLAGVLLVVAVCIVFFDLLFGNQLMSCISGADSHLRYRIWAAVCEVLPSVPLWGCGANATTWELIPYYNEWQLPNYAHNEYLQAWVDYGLVGVLLLVLLLGLHVLRGVRCLASDSVSEGRIHMAITCLQVVVVLALYAFVDFPGHSFAFVVWLAFACGVLASPFSHREHAWFFARKWVHPGRAPHVPVRAQTWPGKLVLLLATAFLAGVSTWLGGKLYPAWRAQWVYNALSKSGEDVNAMARRKLIAQLLRQYPSPALMDTYFMFPQNYVSLAERERFLKITVGANPKQLFTVTMLVDVLGGQKKFAEAECLMREHYVGDSMRSGMLGKWHSFYAFNLLLWGRSEMQQGHHARALSLLDYALRIDREHPVNFSAPWRQGAKPWDACGGVKPGLRHLIDTTRTDLHLLRLTGIQPDDSWQLPLTPGGRPSLYRSYVQKKGR